MPNLAVQRLKTKMYAHQIDGTTLFREWIVTLLGPGAVVLDLGCGPGKTRTDVRGLAKLVVGCDLEREVADNHFVDVAVQGDAYALPFRAASIDVVIADFVLEHLQRPAAMAREACRVLRPGGAVIVRTPNFWHYVALVGWATPHWFHDLVANRVRGLEASHGHEVFPTYYRANSRAAVARVFSGAGFSVERLVMVEREPSYLMFARVPFLCGVAYERFVNSSERLAGCRSNIFAVLRKQRE